MIPCEAIFSALRDKGVSFFTGVPDSLLKSFCAYVSDHTTASEHVIAANEGSAVALAAGHHLATGGLPLVYMQNSGLGNTVNPLTSLADGDVYGIPMLLLVGWRGQPGKKDEPQHRKMGGVTLPSLDALGIENTVLPEHPEQALAAINSAAASAIEHSCPVAIVVPKNTFESYALRSRPDHRYPSTREQAISAILDVLPGASAIIATTGMASRELFELREKRNETHDGDFLTVGSMGHCSQIALGVAMAQPDRHVVCLDGDGAAIMHLGGMTTVGTRAPEQFTHVVLNNAAHDSVGGQPTVGFDIDICGIAKACGYRATARVEDLETLPQRMQELLAAPGPRLLEVRVRTGARADLGRPTRSPKQTKTALMKFLGA